MSRNQKYTPRQIATAKATYKQQIYFCKIIEKLPALSTQIFFKYHTRRPNYTEIQKYPIPHIKQITTSKTKHKRSQMTR